MNYARHSLLILKESAKPLNCACEEENEFFTHWVMRKHPLICTRQPKRNDSKTLQVGIPSYDKENEKKCRYTYVIQKSDVLKIAELPLLSKVFSNHSLDIADDVKIYGSYCWEYLTNLNYVHSDSDLDILIRYANQSIHRLALLMIQLKEQLMVTKVDGEIRFEGIGDCAISELLDTKSKSILFKMIDDLFLMDRFHLYEKYPSLILQ
jgi:phosphoribosyl-dephospho-CoA transferase